MRYILAILILLLPGCISIRPRGEFTPERRQELRQTIIREMWVQWAFGDRTLRWEDYERRFNEEETD